jgi:hypothetical protein
MKNSLETSTKGRIGALLAVIGSAVLLGCLGAAFMVMSYGPSGNYLLKNVLLSPQVAETLKGNPVILERLEYSHWDAVKKQWRTQSISFEQYQAFYELVNGDQSLIVTPEILDAFYRTHPSSLNLFVRSETDPHSRSKPFQRVQFADNSEHFRVELHMDVKDESEKWAYFYHPNLDATALLTQLTH